MTWLIWLGLKYQKLFGNNLHYSASPCKTCPIWKEEYFKNVKNFMKLPLCVFITLLLWDSGCKEKWHSEPKKKKEMHFKSVFWKSTTQ